MTMKSMVQAVLSLASAAAAIPGLALSPTYKDPDLLIMYACLAGAMFATSVAFVVYFWRRDAKETELLKRGEGAK
jgi:POT family proton-dependent oligopeptide transporter